MSSAKKSNTLIGFLIIAVAVVGYFTGLQAPMTPSETPSPLHVEEQIAKRAAETKENVIPAAHYAEMTETTLARASQARLEDLKSSFDPLEEIKITPEDKLAALQQRSQSRAFNGAPPTIPHPIEQRSDASCVACHGAGVKTETLRIPRMSHEFLANCTQCHVESNPRHLQAEVFRENSFAGLEAPIAGPRAFNGAPPQIPHSTWMRSDCLSCHGNAGRRGLRTTHPWRTSCRQCHAPSAVLDQVQLPAPEYLPGPTILK